MGGAHPLLTILVILVAAGSAGWLAVRLRQPRVIGEIVAGILLGPSLLGLVWPAATAYLFPDETTAALSLVAQLGLVLFMFLVGAELRVGLLAGQGHRAVVISHVSIVLPLVLGVALGLGLHPSLGGAVEPLGFALFLGAAMAITAFPVLVRVLQDAGLERTHVGVLTITCAAVDDVTAWCVLAVVVAIVQATGLAAALQTILAAVLFVAVLVGLVRPALARRGEVPLWLALPVLLASAWIAELIGIHALFGAFLAGVVMPRDSHDRLAAGLSDVTRVLLLPVFFVAVGLSTRVDLLNEPSLWAVAALTLGVAVAGKLGGATLAARAVGEPWRDALAIGVLMNTRGLTEVVIAKVGLELGVINGEVFTILVLMALLTTVMASPVLARLYPRSEAPDPALGGLDAVELAVPERGTLGVET